MAYHNPPRQTKGGLGTAVFFMLLAIAGGAFFAATLDQGPATTRVYLAQDISAEAAR